MRLARPHAGGVVLLWFGVLGAPFAWAFQHIAGFTLTQAACSAAAVRNGWDVPLDPWTIVVTALSAAVATASLAAALATFRAVRDAGSAPPAGRVRFLAVIGIAIAPLFLAMTLMSGLGVLFLDDCAQGAQPPIVRPADERGLSQLELGRQLFAANCARCHGGIGQGVATPTPGPVSSGQGPPLIGVGRLAADFYLRTGYMPLRSPHDQPTRRRPPFDEREIAALEAYVDSLGGGPPIPRPRPAAGDVAAGFRLFASHCAGCHQIAAAGGVVTGARVPRLDRATPTQIAQAVRIGPYVMPAFSQNAISDAQLNDLVAYVRSTQHPDNRGGWGIGQLGPVPEGIVAWLIAAVMLIAFCVVLGERMRRT